VSGSDSRAIGGGHSIDLARIDDALRSLDRLQLVMRGEYARLRLPEGRDPLPDDVAGHITGLVRRVNADTDSAAGVTLRTTTSVRLGRNAAAIADGQPWLADWVGAVFAPVFGRGPEGR
jgi:hypothetical protein